MTAAHILPALVAERDLLAAVRDLAKLNGWLIYHTWNSKNSEPGYPDATLVHRATGRVMWRELKTERGRLTDAQQTWLDALRAAGHDADVWRPHDLASGRVLKELRVDRRAATTTTEGDAP